MGRTHSWWIVLLDDVVRIAVLFGVMLAMSVWLFETAQVEIALFAVAVDYLIVWYSRMRERIGQCPAGEERNE